MKFSLSFSNFNSNSFCEAGGGGGEGSEMDRFRLFFLKIEIEESHNFMSNEGGKNFNSEPRHCHRTLLPQVGLRRPQLFKAQLSKQVILQFFFFLIF